MELGGPESTDAKAGLLPTRALDASHIETPSPRTIGSYAQSALGGDPVRLAWSPDGRQICIGSVELSPRGVITKQSIRLVSVNGGRIAPLAGAPEWADTCWTWKSALAAPWIPSDRRVAERYSPRDPEDERPPSIGYTFAGKVVWTTYVRRGQAQFGPGAGFGWAPFAMGAARSMSSIGPGTGTTCRAPAARSTFPPGRPTVCTSRGSRTAVRASTCSWQT